MGEIVSAGTFVAAVLEQAGYVTQERYLDAFMENGFFSEAGALIYILGGIGGVISMVLFGSFRAARYLLLGPALFWFLVSPRVDYDGVIWKIGVGIPRGLNNKEGEAVAKEDVGRVLQNSGTGEQRTIRVGAGFALFARPINNIVQGFIGRILREDTNSYYRMVWSKGRAMEVLLNTRVEDGRFTQIVESDYVRQCSEMYGWALARSSFDLRDDVIAQLSDPTSAQQRQQLYQERFDYFKNNTLINPGREGRDYLVATGVIPKDSPDVKVNCQQMWKFVARYLQDVAIGRAQQVLNIAKGDKAESDLACKELMKKIVEDDGTEPACELEKVVALFLMKNTFMQNKGQGRFLKRIVDSVSEPKAVASGSLIRLISKPTIDELGESIQLATQYLQNPQSMSGMDERMGVQILIGLGEIESKKFGDEAQKNEIRSKFRSYARMSAIGGPLDAGLSEYPQYHLRALRQEIFQFSLNLPYYQGVLLYILAISYPFIALVVLIPGRAAGFLNLPMAWLWVKSWDIGMACVMILERVLWNVLPSMNISKEMIQNNLQNQEMYEALLEARKFDHNWNLHMYYVVLSMVMFAIPGITGYATLRSRRAILSSFTSKMVEDAKDGGARASGMHGMRVMSERVKMMTELQGLASRAARSAGEGVEGAGRAQRAHYWAQISAMNTLARENTNAFQKAVITRDPKALAGIISGDAKANAAYLKTYADIVIAESKKDAKIAAVFDPLIGRYGRLGIMNENYAAAMDGFGGYELNQHTVNAQEEVIKLHQKKMAIMADAATSLAMLNVYVNTTEEGREYMPQMGNALTRIKSLFPDDAALQADPKMLLGSKMQIDFLEGVTKFYGMNVDYQDKRFREDVLGMDRGTDAMAEYFYNLGKVKKDDGTDGFDLGLARARIADLYEFRLSDATDRRFIAPHYWPSLENVEFDADRAVKFRQRGEGIINDLEGPSDGSFGNFGNQPAPGEPMPVAPPVPRAPAAAGSPLSMIGAEPGQFGAGFGEEIPMEGARRLGAPLEQVAISAPISGNSTFIGMAGREEFAEMMKMEVHAGMDRYSQSKAEKERLANLNLDWLFGDTEELEERGHMAHRMSVSKIKTTKGRIS